MAYPITLDSFTDVTCSDTRNPKDVVNDIQDAITALETKVGVTSSAVTTTVDYKLGEVTGTDKAVGKSATQTLTSKTLTSPTINGGSINIPTLVLKQSATPTPTDEGDIQWDTDDNKIKVGDGATTKTFSDDSVSSGIHGITGSFVGTTDTQTLTNKTIGTTNLISFNCPQGYLINGKIVPSVTSNNLTVAIKGLDGNDPSATNPVYCRIGDTVRSIAAALSVTKNAATNWFNSGSAELATKERDYFVYLGYNATDGVVVGFGGFPDCHQYSDFSTTTTNEQYCAISTITNAAATDYYELIGRFAATLSAGAGYTWSVPTFTAINLINHPIYEGRWSSWTPVGSATGSMTFTINTIGKAEYKVVDEGFWVRYNITGTIGGTAGSDAPRMSIPFTPSDDISTNISCGYNAQKNYLGGTQPGSGTPSVLSFFTYDSSAYTTGSGKQFAGTCRIKI